MNNIAVTIRIKKEQVPGSVKVWVCRRGNRGYEYDALDVFAFCRRVLGLWV